MLSFLVFGILAAIPTVITCFIAADAIKPRIEAPRKRHLTSSFLGE